MDGCCASAGTYTIVFLPLATRSPSKNKRPSQHALMAAKSTPSPRVFPLLHYEAIVYPHSWSITKAMPAAKWLRLKVLGSVCMGCILCWFFFIFLLTVLCFGVDVCKYMGVFMRCCRILNLCSAANYSIRSCTYPALIKHVSTRQLQSLQLPITSTAIYLTALHPCHHPLHCRKSWTTACMASTHASKQPRSSTFPWCRSFEWPTPTQRRKSATTAAPVAWALLRGRSGRSRSGTRSGVSSRATRGCWRSSRRCRALCPTPRCVDGRGCGAWMLVVCLLFC